MRDQTSRIDHASRITFTDHFSRVTLMLLRFIIYTILAYLVLRLVRKLLGPSQRNTRASRRSARSAQMIRCESCGMFITQSSALMVGGREFCSKSCAQRASSV